MRYIEKKMQKLTLKVLNVKMDVKMHFTDFILLFFNSKRNLCFDTVK